MKRCSKCGLVKAYSEFHHRANQKDGYDYYCIQCKAEAGLEYRKRRPEVAREYARKWRSENRDREKARVAQWKKENPERYRQNYLRRVRKNRYGITQAQYDALIVASGGRCAICERATQRLVVDHCHKTGKVREMLCHQCNAAIGSFDDDPTFLRKALAYLEKHNEPKD